MTSRSSIDTTASPLYRKLIWFQHEGNFQLIVRNMENFLYSTFCGQVIQEHLSITTRCLGQ